MAAVAVAILAQVLAFSQFPSDTTGLAAIVTAVTTGRVAAVAACRRVPAAPGSVLGGGVAGTQAVPTIMVWVFAVAGCRFRPRRVLGRALSWCWRHWPYP